MKFRCRFLSFLTLAIVGFSGSAVHCQEASEDFWDARLARALGACIAAQLCGAEVQDHEIKGMLDAGSLGGCAAQLRQRFPPVERPRGVIILFSQQLGDIVGRINIVIDDEDLLLTRHNIIVPLFPVKRKVERSRGYLYL